MLIYLLRHGETDWNAEHRMQGQSDIPLNAEGMKQAQLAANHLKNVPFDAIYSSPLIRAKMTAEQVAYGRNLPVLIDERLKEINFGVLEGCPRGSHPMAHTYYHDPVHYIPCEGGETYEDLEKRCSDVWENLLVPLEGIFQTVLVCGHGGWINGLVCYLKNRPLEDFWIDPPKPNGEYILIEYQDGQARFLEKP